MGRQNWMRKALLTCGLALALGACEGGEEEVAILNVDPQVGHTQGEQQVKIVGKNFRQDIGYTVYFGTQKAGSVTIMNPETLVATTPSRDEAESQLQRLTRERDNIGPVNLRAEQEEAELQERIDGMQSERQDLTEAIARLRSGIASLNKEGRERLLAAFEQVNGHFTDLFTRLFGGGEAQLSLTQTDDPLEAGLEIYASPPGKKLQVMSLLSGGEQALTALALLFAVFLVNPAPICVLDEVDAPLDDANVDRFCTLVEELSKSGKTRFLVITHHRMTMARMDRLFGVTMSERGVSQLVSVDLQAAEEMRERVRIAARSGTAVLITGAPGTPADVAEAAAGFAFDPTHRVRTGRAADAANGDGRGARRRGRPDGRPPLYRGSPRSIGGEGRSDHADHPPRGHGYLSAGRGPGSDPPPHGFGVLRDSSRDGRRGQSRARFAR